MGYFVLAAADGEEALQLSRQFPGPIHAVLSDIKMPKMDGLNLRAAILKERPGTKILLMSGDTAMVPQGAAFLQKPFGPDILRARIRELIRASAAKAE